MNRAEIINELIKKFGYKRYLEIGTSIPYNGVWNFDYVQCDYKCGVDPVIDDLTEEGHKLIKATSDDFFAQNKDKWDIIFIDGLHLYEQVLKDILNALEVLNENGTIVVHDCNPRAEIYQLRDRVSLEWNGDVWKAIHDLRLRDDLEVFVLDTDYGCGIIRKGKQDVYKYFDDNRKEILNLKDGAYLSEWLGGII